MISKVLYEAIWNEVSRAADGGVDTQVSPHRAARRQLLGEMLGESLEVLRVGGSGREAEAADEATFLACSSIWWKWVQKTSPFSKLRNYMDVCKEEFLLSSVTCTAVGNIHVFAFGYLGQCISD